MKTEVLFNDEKILTNYNFIVKKISFFNYPSTQKN